MFLDHDLNVLESHHIFPLLLQCGSTDWVQYNQITVDVGAGRGLGAGGWLSCL